MAKQTGPGHTVAQNRRARHDYFIDETLEAGLMLEGSEVKSLRQGSVSLNESWAGPRDGEIYLNDCYIPEYKQAGRHNHEPRRSRKLLLKKREMAKLVAAVKRDGATLVPLRLYFNDRGIAKVELALAHGKKRHDKRQATKERDWKRQKQRLLRELG